MYFYLSVQPVSEAIKGSALSNENASTEPETLEPSSDPCKVIVSSDDNARTEPEKSSSDPCSDVPSSSTAHEELSGKAHAVNPVLHNLVPCNLLYSI